MGDNDMFAPLRPPRAKKASRPDDETNREAEPNSEQESAVAAERAEGEVA